MKKCRNALPVSPWDAIGPPTRPGLSQVSIGGPFVIRSNPVGAIFDNIRRFCSPMGQTEVDEGSFVAENEEYSTPNLSPFDLQSTPAGGYFGDFETGAEAPSANNSCAPGLFWDAGLRSCVPAPATSGGGESTPATARKALSDAIARKDCEAVRMVLDTARSARGRKGTGLYNSWQSVALKAKGWLEANRKLCR